MAIIFLRRDDFGYTKPTRQNARSIARWLHTHHSLAITWTDGADTGGTHYDLVLNYQIKQVGDFQRGNKPRSDLTVSIIGVGAFGFDVDKQSHPNYYAEKLNLYKNSITTEKLTKFLNLIRECLLEYEIFVDEMIGLGLKPETVAVIAGKNRGGGEIIL